MTSVWPTTEAEFALVDHQVDVPQDRLVGPVVHDGDLVEGDHAASSVRGAETYGTGLPGGGARNPAGPGEQDGGGRDEARQRWPAEGIDGRV
ncbi:hypothetical protein SMICM304S_03091 [Streptomyces microflavus]